MTMLQEIVLLHVVRNAVRTILILNLSETKSKVCLAAASSQWIQKVSVIGKELLTSARCLASNAPSSQDFKRPKIICLNICMNMKDYSKG